MGESPKLGFTCRTRVDTGWYPAGSLKCFSELMEGMMLLSGHGWWRIAVFVKPHCCNKGRTAFDYNHLLRVVIEAPSFETFHCNMVIHVLEPQPIDATGFPAFR